MHINYYSSEIDLPLHEFYHRKMSTAMEQYEKWLAETSHAEIYETLKTQLKNYATSPAAQVVAQDLNTAGDDLFLQSAGIYSPPDEIEFAEKYKTNKAVKNAEKAKQASVELAAQLAAAPGGGPGAEIAPRGGYRYRNTKKRIRRLNRTRKRQTKTRRTK